MKILHTKKVFGQGQVNPNLKNGLDYKDNFIIFINLNFLS